MAVLQRRKILVAGLLGAGIAATFLRELVFAWTMGDSPRIEAFRVAFALPNMLGQNLAPALVGAALPALAFAAAHGHGAYLAMRRRVLLASAGLSALLALAGLLAAPQVVAAMAPGFDAAQLADAARTFRILCVFVLLLGLTFGPRADLNLHDVLWPGASSSLVLSLGLVAGCLLGAGLDAVAWAGSIAAGALLGLHLLARARLRGGDPALDEYSGEERPPLLLPMAGIFAYQVAAAMPRFLDRGVASTLEPGTVAALDYSFSIMTAPGLMLGTTFVMIAFPPFTRAVARGRAREAAARGARPFVVLLLAALGAAAALNLLAGPVVALLLGHGAFDAEAAEQTSSLLAWHAVGFPAMVASMVLAQGLMALRRIRALLLVGAARIAVRWAALTTLVGEQDPVGLGQAFAVTEWLSALLLVTLLATALRRRA